MSLLHTIGRESGLFEADLARHGNEMADRVAGSSFLVVGGAGSIGQAVTRQIFARNPRLLHVVDISENNLVEVVRDLRSSIGYGDGEFRTFALDFGGSEFRSLLESVGSYDYVLNLAALKHVRSERDPYTLMRMIQVNVLYTEALRAWSERHRVRKLFCVSTDKATNPVNMMGCSKRIMELFLFGRSEQLAVSTARFANVAFSDGSLLHGFNQRILKNQPLSAPDDVRRYFVTQEESGVLCLASCLLGAHREILFPALDEDANQITFSEIASRFLRDIGYEPVVCASEEEARRRVAELKPQRKWPVYYFSSDTTGEKSFEEFYRDDSDVDWDRFDDIGVIRHPVPANLSALAGFESRMAELLSGGHWSKADLVEAFVRLVPEFAHYETGKYLDERM